MTDEAHITIAAFIAAGIIISCFVLLPILQRRSKKLMELAQAYAIALDAGTHLAQKGWHIWKAKDDYVILRFDDNANPLDSTEERYPGTSDGRSDAVLKFMRKVVG